MATNVSVSKHSTLMNIPNGPLQNVVPNFNMAQFLRFRGVCRLFYQIVDTSERDIVRQLLNNPELWQAGRIFGDTGPEMGSYNYLFGLKDDQPVETEIRSRLLMLTHYLENNPSSLKAFVSDPNNKPHLRVPNEEIEALALAKYDYKAAYHLCSLHRSFMGLLNKRLDAYSLTMLNIAHAPNVKYSKLVISGSIEVIKDSILPSTLLMRIRRTCGACAPSLESTTANIAPSGTSRKDS